VKALTIWLETYGNINFAGKKSEGTGNRDDNTSKKIKSGERYSLVQCPFS